MNADFLRQVIPSALRRAFEQNPAIDERLEAEGLRPVGALVAIAAGLPTMVALIAAAADPSRSLVPIAFATGLSAVAAGLALFIRLREARDDLRQLATKLEASQDSNWQLTDVAAGSTTPRLALPIATVSHEMRAPLHGMLGLTDLLLETSLTAEQQSYGRAIHSSAGALSRLVDDLIDYGRIEAGRFLLEPAPARIEPIVEAIAELMAPRAHAKGVGLATRVDPAMPIVEIDEVRLRQVLINLVGNAVAFTDRGAVVLSVDVGAETGNGLISIGFTVSDSGPGVAPEDRARIFLDFERASSQRGGAGLGLAISQRIVNRMGGSIEVEDRVGGGSIFRFGLMLPKRGKPGDINAAALARKNVLIVAEATMETETLGALLVDVGAIARVASTVVTAAGLIGAAEAAGLGYDVVLFDARRDIDRRLAIARLREAAGRPVPAVVLIEPSQRRAIDDFRAEGFDAYLIRPIRHASLLRVLGDLVAGKGGFHADPVDRPRDAAPGRRSPSSLRVLIAEDDPVSALLIRAVLEKLGHDVTEAGTAALARQAAEAAAHDIVLIDIQLADESGLDLIRSLRRTMSAGQSIIAISGSGDLETRVAAEQAGADLYLEKPISPDVLRRAVEAVAARRAA